MRLRTDSGHIAGWKRAHALIGCPNTKPIDGVDECVCTSQKPEYVAVPPAAVGDVWRIPFGAKSEAERTGGYALTCPNEACDQGVHFWTHAYDCENRAPEHVSCWTWTGAPEDGTLSAQPSLWVVPDRGGCGWHGFLTNGEMRSV